MIGPLIEAREMDVLKRVVARARNLGCVTPSERQGEMLHLETEEWRLLADVLTRLVTNGRTDRQPEAVSDEADFASRGSDVGGVGSAPSASASSLREEAYHRFEDGYE